MNKWKIAFFISLTLLLAVSVFSIYAIIDQGVTISYTKQGYADTESDLKCISNIITQTDLTKSEIKNSLKQHKLFEYMDFSKDTISLDRINLVFKDNKLIKVVNQW